MPINDKFSFNDGEENYTQQQENDVRILEPKIQNKK